MGHIFTIIGKSATGKDFLFNRILDELKLPLKTVVTYTTRPIRAGEKDGVVYNFRTIPEFLDLREKGLVIESRCYHTMLGDWYYFTVDDGQITPENDYLMITTLEGFESLRNFYGSERVVPLYVEVNDGERLSRAVKREMGQKTPKFDEVCRRYLADEIDFSDDKIVRLGITRRFDNLDSDTCLHELQDEIKSRLL